MSQITVGRDGDIRHTAMSARQIADATNQTTSHRKYSLPAVSPLVIWRENVL